MGRRWRDRSWRVVAMARSPEMDERLAAVVGGRTATSRRVSDGSGRGPGPDLRLAGGLPVDGEVEARLFGAWRDPQPEGQAHDLDDDERGHNGVDDRGRDREELGQDLARVAVDQALVGLLDGARREDAGRDGAEHAAHAVDRKDVERV